MLASIQEAFENASEMQPEGEARIGELETSVLTDMCAELTGGDARETAIQLFLRNFKETDSSWKDEEELYYNANRQDFIVFFIGRCVKVGAQGGPTECGRWTITDCDDDNDVEPALRKAFQLMEDNLLCSGCKLELALGKDFGLCHGCQKFWNTVPCSKCGCHFGYLKENGKHNHCQ
jgi:hypothetical protein